MGSELNDIKGGVEPTELTNKEYVIITEKLESVPEKDRSVAWIIHGTPFESWPPPTNSPSLAMKDIDLDSKGFKQLHLKLKTVYQTLKDKNKKITPVQMKDMYDIMMYRRSRKIASLEEATNAVINSNPSLRMRGAL